MEYNNQNINENDYIIIPNPLYDVVFKYLMEDNESAIIILSTLINEKIKKLTFEPLSHTEKVKAPNSEKDINLFHLDFTAIVELPDGSEDLIMIEIQKANQANDIFRFKRYISANFQKKQEKEIVNPHTQAIEKINKPIRLIPIFILNFRIENEIDDLLIVTNRLKRGIFKDKLLEKTNEFIDNLSYDIWVVQLPNLHKIKKEEYENDEYKSKLYSLFNLFDQEAKNPKNTHRLLLLRKQFPNFLERVIQRLRAADADNPELEEQMFAEDEYLSELNKMYNDLSWFKEKLETEKKLSQDKDRIIISYAKFLKENGKNIHEIKLETGLSEAQIEKL